MKRVIISIPVALSLVILSCSQPKQFMNGRPRFIVRGDTTTKVEYYETDFEAKQKDYMTLLVGSWNIASMQRQARLSIENLSNTSLRLNPDKTFSLLTSCGTLAGNYTVKGTSIRFSDISASSGCSEQERELVRLLTNTVSTYTVSSNSLLLRDGSTNIVFRASK